MVNWIQQVSQFCTTQGIDPHCLVEILIDTKKELEDKTSLEDKIVQLNTENASLTAEIMELKAQLAVPRRNIQNPELKHRTV